MDIFKDTQQLNVEQERIRERIINGGLFVLSIIGIPALAISLSRIEKLDAQPILYIHMALVFAILLTTALRKYININIRAWIIVLVVYIAGVTGLSNLGTGGSGWSFLALATVLSSVLLGYGTAILVFVASCITIVFAGWGFATESFVLTIDLNAYSAYWSTWINVLVDYIIICTCTISAFYFLNKALLQSLSRLKKEIVTLKTDLEQKSEEVEEEKKKAEDLSRRDFLTGLHNRRSFFEFGEHINEEAKRYKKPYTIIMMDMDNFKKINDKFGQKVGDLAIQSMANVVSDLIRTSDIAARVGGDEIAVILPNTEHESVIPLAKRLSQKIAKISLPSDHGKVAFTASFGMASFNEHTNTMESVMLKADSALYKAKKNGKNQIEVYTQKEE